MATLTAYSELGPYSDAYRWIALGDRVQMDRLKGDWVQIDRLTRSIENGG